MKELLYLKDDQLKDLIEKLFVSYRETFSDSKKILDRYSIGLAHHKVIHLLSMYEGISISELLKRLKVTKQSLNRVLKDLIKLEIIIFKNESMRINKKHVIMILIQETDFPSILVKFSIISWLCATSVWVSV